MAEVRDDAAAGRYELATPAGPAIAAYADEDGVRVFTHTEVPADERGEGIASRLIAGALADVRARGLHIVAQCPFVRAYLDAHPAERDLLASG